MGEPTHLKIFEIIIEKRFPSIPQVQPLPGWAQSLHTAFAEEGSLSPSLKGWALWFRALGSGFRV